MPAEPIQVTILEALKDALEEIVEGEEYFNTLLGKVHIGRTVLDDEDADPDELAVLILENPLPEDERQQSIRAGGETSGDWGLFIQAFVPIKDKTDRFLTRDAYCLKEDILCRLRGLRTPRGSGRAPNFIFGIKQIANIRFDRGVVGADEKRSNYAVFWIPLTIDLSSR